MIQYGLIELVGAVETFVEEETHDLLTLDMIKKLSNGNPMLRPINLVADPPLDPATQKFSSYSYTVLATQVDKSRTVVAMSQGELDDLDRNKIVGAMLDLGFIVIKLVDKLIALNVIAATDFDATTKQEYQDLKALVNRLRP